MVTLQLPMSLVCILPLVACNYQPADPEQAAANAIHQSLGVEFAVAESKLRRSIIRTKTPYGFKMSKVEKDSPAAGAGCRDGDVLLEWNGQPIKSLTDLDTAIKKVKNGEAGKFKLARLKKDEPIWSRQPWQHVEGQVVPK